MCAQSRSAAFLASPGHLLARAWRRFAPSSERRRRAADLLGPSPGHIRPIHAAFSPDDGVAIAHHGERLAVEVRPGSYAEECDRRRLFSDRPGRLVNPRLPSARCVYMVRPRVVQCFKPAVVSGKKSRFRHVGCNLLPRCNLMSTLGVCAVQGGRVGRTVLATKLQWDGGACGFLGTAHNRRLPYWRRWDSRG